MTDHPENTPSLSDAAQAIPIPPRYWWLKRITVATGSVLLGLIAMRLYWGYEANRRLGVEIARIRAAGEPLTGEDLNPPRVPDETNGALLLEQATEALRIPTDFNDPYHLVSRRLRRCQDHLDSIETILSSNVKVRSLIRESRSMPHAVWSFRWPSNIHASVGSFKSGFPEFRQLARFSAVAAMYHHVIGDDAEAVESVRDMLHMADARVCSGGMPIEHLVSMSISSLSNNAVGEIASTLRISNDDVEHATGTKPASREQVLALIDELLDEQALQDSWQNVWSEERVYLLGYVDSNNKELLTPNRVLFSGWSGVFSRPTDWLLGQLFDPMLRMYLVHESQNYRQATVANHEQTYPLNMAKRPEKKALDEIVRRVNAHFLSFSLELDRLYQLHWHVIAGRRMAAIALAIRLYESDHGYRPAALTELVPVYFPGVPRDPFRKEDGPIGYKPDADMPVLYSVGINGLDENGRLGSSPTGLIDYNAMDAPFFLDVDKRPDFDGALAGNQKNGKVADDAGDDQKDTSADENAENRDSKHRQP